MVTANAFSVGDFVEAMNEAKRIIAKQADEIERLREALKKMKDEQCQYVDPAKQKGIGDTRNETVVRMDIVERLRSVGGIEGTTRWYINPDGPEAANEIERLQWDAALAVKRGFDLNDAYQELERLRDALATVATSEISTIEEIKLFARAALKGEE